MNDKIINPMSKTFNIYSLLAVSVFRDLGEINFFMNNLDNINAVFILKLMVYKSIHH